MERSEFMKWLREIEVKWQKLWREYRVFEADADPDKPKFYITVPYPYTNAPLHIGHGRTYTIGDIIARYKRLRGYNVLFPMAFHITGTPIVAISERIARGDQKEIERYRSYIAKYIDDPRKIEEYLERFKDPYELATFFAERVHMDFDALGYSIDWRRKFHTGEPIYNAFVTWQYLRLRDKGLIKRGDHIVTYCLLHKQPEGEDDIQDADTNPVEILEFIAIKFRLEDSNDTYLVAATLRPETLFGATNVWVKPDAKYLIVKWRGDRIVLSEKACIKLKHQYPEDDIVVEKEIIGRELIGKYVVSPLGRKLLVLPAEFVDPDNATGIVYSEPSDAPYDYVALMNIKKNPEKLREYSIDPSIVEGIEPIKIIDVPGISDHHAKVVVEEMGITDQLDPRLVEATRIVYKEQYYKGRMIVDDPEFKGLSVSEAKEKIKEKLFRENMGFIFYELNRKAFCRAGGEIIVAKIKGQWFIDYSTKWWKEKTKEYVVNKLVVVPEKYRQEILNTIDWLEMRPCARKRGLGTKLPFDPEWIIESLSDSTIYMAFYTIAHIIRDHGIKKEQLKPEVFDYVFYGKGDPENISRESGISVEVLENMRREFIYWYPVDQRHTGIPHLSNHLTFYIFHHIALFPPNHWPRMITLNEMVIREGAKMSKSKGNVILLREIAEKYSADLFRLYAAGAANLDTLLDWREKDVATALDSLRRFIGIVKRVADSECSVTYRDRFIDKWFLSRFNKLLLEATNALETMEIRDYVQKIFYQVLSMIDHYRERTSEEETICMVKNIIDKWVKALNPVIPHLTEEVWEWLGYEKFLSTSSWPEIDFDWINDEVEILEDMIDSLIDDLKNVLNVIKPVKKHVILIVASPWKREAIKLLSEGYDQRKVIETIREKYGLKGREKEIIDVIQRYRKEPNKDILLTSAENEYKILLEAREYIAKKTGLQVTIYWEEEAREKNIPRAEKSYPLKPGFYIE
ncbi:MAG: leucine--tRNA ligase [Desulfurococcales archaeon ex4484_58]|nr:MAG: leucine--tRNA ligase [Desulfurococcales archaeon ex4484_58]